jgi:CDP-glycerol glycerophosphotransferase (TagB/SpsB family)
MSRFMKKFIIWAKRLLSNFPFFDYLFKIAYVNLYKIIFWYKYNRQDIVEEAFLFECFKGKMVNDSPFAIYQYLHINFPLAKFTWVLSSPTHPMHSMLKENRNTSVVIYGTDEYFQAYATSKYWIVNCRIPYRVVKKKGQVFVQCWHGTPLKKLGFDIQMDDNAKVSKSSLRYAYSIDARKMDYFISPSPYASRCFISGFGLQKDQVLELGYPRNDALFQNHSDIDLIKKLKLSLNIAADATVILYAPTWRDNSFCNERQSHILHNPLENESFLSKFSDDVVFLYRGHYFTDLYNKSSRFIDVSDYNNINDLYLISDLLITDYSSVFFDYALLNRPILFFMYDRNEYESKIRGVYLDNDKDFPGKITSSRSILANNILIALNEKTDLSNFNEIFNPHEDGFSAQRVTNALVKKRNINARL